MTGHTAAARRRLVVEGFAGPGGWSTALSVLADAPPVDLVAVGFEHDIDACRTAMAAGHLRVCADVSTFPLDRLAGHVEGIIMSAPCQAWSQAGAGGGRLDQAAIFAHLARVERAGEWIDYPRTLCPAGPDCQPRPAGPPVQDSLFGEPAVAAPVEAVVCNGGWHDARSPLVLEPVRWVLALRPRWVALEQVPAVLPLWQAIARLFRGLGYSAESGLLSAERYGVPQTRKRAFLVARRDGAPARLPEPTHHAYKPGQPDPTPEVDLHGRRLRPWVSMAAALGFDLLDAPCPTVMTARDRQSGPTHVLRCGSWRAEQWRQAGQDPARWAVRTEQTSQTAAGRVPTDRPLSGPAPTLVANADRWTVRSSVGQPKRERDTDTGGPGGDHEFDPAARPAHVATGRSRSWSVRTNQVPGGTDDYQHRAQELPSPTVSGQGQSWAWVLEAAGREKLNDRTLPRPIDAPATTIAFGHSDMRWRFVNNNQDNAAARDLAEPVPTVFFGARLNTVNWVGERPATTVQGDARVLPPGHKVNGDDEAAGRTGYGDRAGTEAVRVEVWQAGVLQSFPGWYPWQGTRTAQYRQVGDAVPPLLAAAVLGELLDVNWRALLWGEAS
jgi:DNA (cytosine-5)-methyltransferase 1